MSHTEVRADILAQVIQDLGQVFATKDVSEDERVRNAHPQLTAHRQYHAFVGKALMLHHVQLGVLEVRKGTQRGSEWQKPMAQARDLGALESNVPRPEATPQRDELGPQHAGDARFTARMRRHQSWYRSRVLGLPCGTGPTPQATRRLGNMLTREDGAAGHNFLTPGIARLTEQRLRDGLGTVEPYRLLHNMLSSQPMCFNLFGPLAADLELAVPLVGALVPDHIMAITQVLMEWAPSPAHDYLGDRTAFDAFIEYRTFDGRLCALGIETKLTEPFSRQVYDGDSYRRWMRASGSTWRADSEAQVQKIEHNQLWRDHLLAVALRYHPRSQYGTTRLLVVHHPEDLECVRALEGYRALLQVGCDSLLSLSLDQLVGSWSGLANQPEPLAWLRAFRTRYLDLHLSEADVAAPRSEGAFEAST